MAIDYWFYSRIFFLQSFSLWFSFFIYNTKLPGSQLVRVVWLMWSTPNPICHRGRLSWKMNQISARWHSPPFLRLSQPLLQPVSLLATSPPLSQSAENWETSTFGQSQGFLSECSPPIGWFQTLHYFHKFFYDYHIVELSSWLLSKAVFTSEYFIARALSSQTTPYQVLKTSHNKVAALLV